MFRVPEICKEKGITQKELAIRMGVRPSSLNEAINGNLRYSTMMKIAKALDVSVPDLFEERDRVKILVRVNRETYEISENDILEIINKKRAANR